MDQYERWNSFTLLKVVANKIITLYDVPMVNRDSRVL